MSQQIATAPPAAPERPRAWFQSGRFLLFLAGLLVIYGYGWRVTNINLPELVKGATFVRPFVRDLARPDVLTRRMEISEAQVALIHTDARGAFTETITVPEAFRGPEAGPRGAQQRILVRVERPVGPLRPSNTAVIVFQKIIETVFLALMGTTIAVLVAVPLSFLGARNLMARNPVGTTIYYVTRTFFNIMRSIEPLILAIVFTVWVGLGPFAGVLALGLHSIAALGKLYSSPSPSTGGTPTSGCPPSSALWAGAASGSCCSSTSTSCSTGRPRPRCGRSRWSWRRWTT